MPSGLTEEGVIGWFEFHKRGDTWDVDARYVPTLLTIPPDADAGGTQEADAAVVKDHRLVDLAGALQNGEDLPAAERPDTGWPSSGPRARCSTGAPSRTG